jgi:threonine dehydrogenase-like Zn-dependent dehydrogenase
VNTDTIATKTVRVQSPGTLAFEDGVMALHDLAEDEVAAETLVTVISPGTESAAYSGAPPLRDGVVYPRLVGYCNVARVLATGPKVDTVRPGDRILTLQSHRSAFRCKANAVIARLPESADSARCAAAYLYHLGYNALLKADFRPGCNVAVIGLGALGLATVSLASVGGGNVFAFSGHEAGRARGRQAGARVVFSRDEDWTERVDADTGGTGIDIVVTTSSDWRDWQLALQVARREGVVAVLGFPGRGAPLPEFNPLASNYFYYKQLRVMACGFSPESDVPVYDVRFTLKRNMAYLLDLIASGRLDAGMLVSETRDWREIESVYRRLIAREPGLVTAALQWK